MNHYLEIKASFERLGDKEKASMMGAYMRNQFVFYGIATPTRREAYQQILSEQKRLGKIDWTLLETCWHDEHREFQYFVTDYLKALQKHLVYDDIVNIERYVRSKQWWDTIDSLDRIVGRIGLKDKRVNDLMLRWSLDDDFWVRRVAIDHQLCRKDKTETDLLETIIVNNFGSKEFFINKAIGWSLRDYSKTNPEWVRRFLETYCDRMSLLSIREASKYI